MDLKVSFRPSSAPPPSNRTTLSSYPSFSSQTEKFGFTVPEQLSAKVASFMKAVLYDGAAEDGRAPTEELSCVIGSDFCSMEVMRTDVLNRTGLVTVARPISHPYISGRFTQMGSGTVRSATG